MSGNFKNNKTILESFPKYLSDLIKGIIDKENISSIENVKVNHISTEGGNFLADLFEIDISGKTKEGDKVLNLFLKKAVPAENMTLMSIDEVYLRETFVYSDLFKMFDKIQENAKVPENERFKAAKSFTELNAEIIVLENLSRQGFTTLFRMDVMPLEFAELSIQELAKYHALAFALEKFEPEYFRKCKQLDYLPRIDDDFATYVGNIGNAINDYLNPQIQEKVKQFMKKIPEIYTRCLIEPSSVMTLCHGDFRTNNILVKLTDGVPTAVVPVDYQIINYKCPVNDLLYFIYSGTDRQFREKHLDYLKNMYHDTLGKFLLRLKIDVETVFPRKDFENIFYGRMDFALASTFFMLPILFSKENESPEITSGSLADVTFTLDERFKERTEGNVEELIMRGII